MDQPAPAAKPYITVLQQEGEWKRLIDDIVDFVSNKMEDPGQSQGPIYEQALRLVWSKREIDGSTNHDELQRWLVSLRENPDNTNPFLASISPGGFFMKGILLQVITPITKLRWKNQDERS